MVNEEQRAAFHRVTSSGGPGLVPTLCSFACPTVFRHRITPGSNVRAAGQPGYPSARGQIAGGPKAWVELLILEPNREKSAARNVRGPQRAYSVADGSNRGAVA